MTNKPMTPERLAEIRQRVEAAMRDAVQVEHEYSTGQRAVCVPNLNECAAWWELIEHAPANILALLTALEAATREISDLEESVAAGEQAYVEHMESYEQEIERFKEALAAQTAQIVSLQEELARRDAYVAKQIEHSRAVKETIK